VDSLYLGALRKRGVVAPSVAAEYREANITGGYVMESRPGLYRNVLVFDFKSLYPSIIRTFNLDPLTRLDASVPDAVGEPVLVAPTVRASGATCAASCPSSWTRWPRSARRPSPRSSR